MSPKTGNGSISCDQDKPGPGTGHRGPACDVRVTPPPPRQKTTGSHFARGTFYDLPLRAEMVRSFKRDRVSVPGPLLLGPRPRQRVRGQRTPIRATARATSASRVAGTWAPGSGRPPPAPHARPPPPPRRPRPGPAAPRLPPGSARPGLTSRSPRLGSHRLGKWRPE